MNKLDEAADAFSKGLEIDPNSNLLKTGLVEVENAKAYKGMNENPMAKIFAGDVVGRMAANPSLAPFLSQPDIMAKVQQCQQNPALINTMMQDQRMIQIIMGLMGLNSSMMGQQHEEEQQQPEPTPQKPTRAATPPPEPVAELTEEEQEKKGKRDASDAEKAIGNQEYKKRNFEEALAHYDKAYDLDKSNVAVLTNKSAVLFEQANYEECIKVCQSAVDAGRDYLSDFTLIAKAYGRMGNCYAKLNDLESAIKFLEKSLAEHRTKEVLEKLRDLEKQKKEADKQAYRNPQLADEAREKGNELFKAGSYVEAVKFYTESIKRNDEDPKNFSNRAACYMKLMALPEADRDCDQAIKIDPSFVKAYIRKAAILFAKRDFMKCIDYCNEIKLVDVDNKHTAEIDGQISRCYSALNQVQSGENEEEIKKRAMENPEVQAVLSDPTMRMILEQMQQDPGAARDHMKNPQIAAKIRILMNAGILRMG